MKLYVASSWRNIEQPGVVDALREAGHEVYDFRNPSPGDTGFQWSAIDPDWQGWDAQRFRGALGHPIAKAGFGKDWEAMEWADAGVLVLPCGRSAHLEAGYFVGAGKPLVILVVGEKTEPELMYKMADRICLSVDSVVAELAAVEERMIGADTFPNWSLLRVEALSARTRLAAFTKRLRAALSKH